MAIPACFSLPCQAPAEMSKQILWPIVHVHMRKPLGVQTLRKAAAFCVLSTSAGMHRMLMYHGIMAVLTLSALVICQLMLKLLTMETSTGIDG